MGNTEKDMIKAGKIYVDASYHVIYVGKRGIARTRNRTLGRSTTNLFNCLENKVVKQRELVSTHPNIS